MDRELFAGAGSLTEPYSRVDWAATELGPPAAWSPTLRRAAALVLDTGFPASLLWGPEFVLVYNEAFVSLIGDKHPAALGNPASQVFAEAWDLIGPMMTGVLAGTGALWVQDAPVPLQRGGTVQQAYFTFSYSPVRNDRGEIEGVMDIATETTRQVVDRRRLLLLGRLRASLADVDRLDGFADRILSVLHRDREDLPDIAFRGLDGHEREVVPAPSAGGPDGPIIELALHFTGADERAAMLVRINRQQEEDDSYRPFLQLVAEAVSQTLDRAVLHARERRRALEERKTSETLQRALLTEPPLRDASDRLAVRYLPGTAGAQVGGDWHDAFITGGGRLTLVIGDVTGHDRNAAASMGQLRNILRGIATSLPDPPDRVLARLDMTMSDLGLDTLATAIVAQLDPPDATGGARRLVWSSAGHPPPCLIAPSGRVELMTAAPDPLLGLQRDSRRSAHELTLAPGSALVLYTDGLTERRGKLADDGFRWLCGVLEGHAGDDPEAIADLILGELGEPLADDVALLVLAVTDPGAPPVSP